jgi:hypothetical protein
MEKYVLEFQNTIKIVNFISSLVNWGNVRESNVWEGEINVKFMSYNGTDKVGGISWRDYI